MQHPGFARALYVFGQVVCVLGASFIILLTVIGVLMRSGFNKAIFGGDELTNLVLAPLIGAGLILVSALRIHIRVDLFESGLKRRWPRGHAQWVSGFDVLGTLALGVLLLLHAWHTLKTQETSVVLEWPVGGFYLATGLLVLGGACVHILGLHVLSGEEDQA